MSEALLRSMMGRIGRAAAAHGWMADNADACPTMRVCRMLAKTMPLANPSHAFCDLGVYLPQPAGHDWKDTSLS